MSGGLMGKLLVLTLTLFAFPTQGMRERSSTFTSPNLNSEHTASGEHSVHYRDHQHSNEPQGRWTTVNRTTLEQSVPHSPSHLQMTKPHSQGLPEGCITYEERYRKFIISDSRSLVGLNEQNVDSKHAVLVRTHSDLQWSMDFVLSMRALVHEVHEAGWHPWILMQLTVGPEPKDKTPAHFLKSIPTEFRQFVHTFTAEEIHREFPDVHLYMEEENAGMYDARRRGYLGPASFLRRYPSYEFAYIMEYDVRYIGRHWGELFNAALSTALQAMAGEDIRLEPQSLGSPPDHAQPPDLLLFSEWVGEPNTFAEFKNPDLQMNASQWKFTHVTKAMITLYGISRKMVDAIVKHSLHGNGGFMELFVPSVAYHEPLETVFLPVGDWNDTFAMTWSSNVPALIYDEWYESQECQNFTLLHPVKNSDLMIWKEWYSGE